MNLTSFFSLLAAIASAHNSIKPFKDVFKFFETNLVFSNFLLLKSYSEEELNF